MEHQAPDAPVVRFGIKHFAAGSRRLARGLDHRLDHRLEKLESLPAKLGR